MTIAAIYARKSTDQNLPDSEKSVTRQVEHACTYAAHKGWTVAESHVYVDDRISGAIFGAGPPRPGACSTRWRRAAFAVLIMSEESRLGRERIETEDRERALGSATDKVMLSLTSLIVVTRRLSPRSRTPS
jgi:hypothetical protein